MKFKKSNWPHALYAASDRFSFVCTHREIQALAMRLESPFGCPPAGLMKALKGPGGRSSSFRLGAITYLVTGLVSKSPFQMLAVRLQ